MDIGYLPVNFADSPPIITNKLPEKSTESETSFSQEKFSDYFDQQNELESQKSEVGELVSEKREIKSEEEEPVAEVKDTDKNDKAEVAEESRDKKRDLKKTLHEGEAKIELNDETKTENQQVVSKEESLKATEAMTKKEVKSFDDEDFNSEISGVRDAEKEKRKIKKTPLANERLVSGKAIKAEVEKTDLDKKGTSETPLTELNITANGEKISVKEDVFPAGRERNEASHSVANAVVSEDIDKTHREREVKPQLVIQKRPSTDETVESVKSETNQDKEALSESSTEKKELLPRGQRTDNHNPSNSSVEGNNNTKATPFHLISDGLDKNPTPTSLKEAPLNRAAESVMRRLAETNAGESIRQIRFIVNTAESGQIYLRLRPESLGRVTIDLRMDQNAVRGEIVVDNNAVSKILEGALGDLNDALRQSGFNDTALNVSVNGGKAGNDGSSKKSMEKNSFNADVENTDSIRDSMPWSGGNSERINMIA